MMLWFVLALVTALSRSAGEVLGKKCLRGVNEYVVVWFSAAVAVPLLGAIAAVQGMPALGPGFWPAWLAAVTLDTLGFIFFFRAIKLSDLSLVSPLQAVTPALLLVTEPLMLHAAPPLAGVLGVLLLVVGMYVLKIRESRLGWARPLKALVSSAGPRYMLLTAVIWSVNSNVDKIGVQNSSPMFWITASYLGIALATLPFALPTLRRKQQQVRAHAGILVAVGLAFAIEGATQMYAISLALVAYVLAVKRTSILWSVLLGAAVFKEKGIRERLAGALLMVAGVLLILLS